MKAMNYMDKILSEQEYIRNGNDYIYECEDYIQIISYKENHKNTDSDWITIRFYDKNDGSDDFCEYAINKNSNAELKIIFKDLDFI